MTDRPASPPRAAIQCYLTVHDGAAAVDFYRRAFGAEEVVRQMAADAIRIDHCALAMFGGEIMLADEFPELLTDTVSPRRAGAPSVTIHVNLPVAADVDAVLLRAAGAGASVSTPPTDVDWGARYARLIDPFGHAWAFAAPRSGSAA